MKIVSKSKEPVALTGEWEGWTKHGGGSTYLVKSPDDLGITLYYDIAGSAIGRHRSTAASSRPWSVQVKGKRLLNAAGNDRVFGSKEAARKAAEQAAKNLP